MLSMFRLRNLEVEDMVRVDGLEWLPGRKQTAIGVS